MAASLTLSELGPRLGVAVLVSSFVSIYALRKKSLNLSGAIFAFFVGGITFASGFRFGATLLVFFFSSSKLTKLKAEFKRRFDSEYKEGGQRDWKQVLANGFTGTFAAALYLYFVGSKTIGVDFSSEVLASSLLCVFLGHYATCCGDTWASEVGVLNKRDPILITTFKRVSRGTNGGISELGTAASVLGGAAMGLTMYLVGLLTMEASSVPQWPLIPLGALLGLAGSLIDSLLGATIQFSGYCHKESKMINDPALHRGHQITHISGIDLLSNDQVNFISAVIGAVLAPYIGRVVFSVLM